MHRKEQTQHCDLIPAGQCNLDWVLYGLGVELRRPKKPVSVFHVIS